MTNQIFLISGHMAPHRIQPSVLVYLAQLMSLLGTLQTGEMVVVESQEQINSGIPARVENLRNGRTEDPIDVFRITRTMFIAAARSTLSSISLQSPDSAKTYAWSQITLATALLEPGQAFEFVLRGHADLIRVFRRGILMLPQLVGSDLLIVKTNETDENHFIVSRKENA